MPMTIPQYAKERHISDQGVYRALERHPEIRALIFIGKSNGKDAKMLPDEAMGMLDQVMRHPYQFTDDNNKDIQIFHSNEINKLNNQLLKEMGDTRKEMIAAVGSAVKESMLANTQEIMSGIEDLKNNQATLEQIERGLSKIREALEEQYKSQEKALMNEINKLKKQIDEQQKKYWELYKENATLERELKSSRETLEYAQKHPLLNLLFFHRKRKQ